MEVRSPMKREEQIGKVTCERRDRILVVKIDNAPVNAMNFQIRQGLIAAIDTADGDEQVDAVMLIGEGRNFSGGADIREFGKPLLEPSLPDVCNRIEACTKPVIAVIQGVALGGGTEIALAAHYRFAVGTAKLGLPEVGLGILPGGGGTQRAPRLLGAQAALDLMLTGRKVDAAEAHTLGLIDRLGKSEDALSEGLVYVEELLHLRAGRRPTRDATGLSDKTTSAAAIRAAHASIAEKSRGLFSPFKIVEAVNASLEQPFDEGLRTERRLFLECIVSPQRAGLIHAFFSEREVWKLPETCQVAPRAIRSVGIIGGGLMGAGIAVAVLDAGLPVLMVERDEASLKRGRSNIEKVYDRLIQRGRVSAEQKERVMARWTGSTSYAALGDVDLVIEAVFEDLSVKKEVFQRLNDVLKSGAVIATNTSYLDVDALAAEIPRPQDVIGLHFFSPANVMKLLEVVVPAKVSPDVVATAFDLAKRLGKIPVRAGVCDGFIGNRILAIFRGAAEAIMEDGASPYQIDNAVRDFGFAMGPFQTSDLSGGDIGWATRKRRSATRDPKARYVQIPGRLCERGWIGQKSGRGYYLYPEGSRQGMPDPEVEAIIDDERRRAQIKPRTFTDDEIIHRYMAAMINEGAKVVEEGIALRPLDVDVVFLYGYGFPRFRGGPMKYADTVGLETVLDDIRTYEKEDPLFWRPSQLLVDLVARGDNFASLNGTI